MSNYYVNDNYYVKVKGDKHIYVNRFHPDVFESVNVNRDSYRAVSTARVFYTRFSEIIKQVKLINDETNFNDN